jgi:transglutaminase superfamily protein
VGEARAAGGQPKTFVRTVLRSAVLLAWSGVMAVMVYRIQALREPITTVREPLPAESSELWQGIYREGVKVGYSHRRRTPTADGFTVETDTVVHLAMMGTSQVVRTRLEADTDRTLKLRRFDFRLRAGTIDFKLTGRARGAELELSSESLGERSVSVPLSTPMVLSETLQDMLGQERLETGKKFRYTLFDPVSGQPAPVDLEVGPLERSGLPAGVDAAFRVTEDFRGSRFQLWVEPSGQVVKEEGPLGLVLVRERGARAAMSGLDRSAGLDLVAAAAIPVARAIASPRTLSVLSLRVSGVPATAETGEVAAGLSFPPRQVFEGGRLRIEREERSELRSYELPARESQFAPDLASTPFLQSDDQEVRKVSREALGGERDAAEAAEKLLDWVFRNLIKSPAVSVPNARDVLRDRRGDCNEHAVLYAALGRAAGLPARVVAGTVYMPGDDGSPGAFYYHAWDEVWLGRWVAVDPTFGQFPADATHVKLIDGGPEKHVALLAMIGKLELAVEDSK